MTRVLIPLLLVAVGCAPPTPPADPPASAEPPLPTPAAFAAWPTVTPEPFQVPGPALWDCRGPSEKETATHGPHLSGVLVVRVNPEAADAFRERKPLLVGTTIVKEKYLTPIATVEMAAYAVMTKRAPGYDPDGGDWEYAYVRLGESGSTERGRLANCVGCHRSAGDRDGLFRPYLPAAK